MWRVGVGNDMRKIGKTAWCIALMTLMMTGCGAAKVPDAVDKPAIAIAKSGEVTEYLVTDFFEKPWYAVTELRAMAVEEAAQYNTENQKGKDVPVTVEAVEKLDDGSDRIRVVYRYDNADSYTGFNDDSLFYGTVGQAALKGYSVNVALKSVRENGSAEEKQLEQATDQYLIIAPAGVYVYCPGKVEYISEGASVAEDGSVDTTQAQESVYILLK